MCDKDKLNIIDKFIKNLDIKQDIVQLEEIKIILNPLNAEEQCCLLNSKKKEFYRYEYNPRKFFDSMNDFYKSHDKYVNKEFYISYIEKFNRIIDPTSKKNCCNCVSFTLYIIDETCKDFTCKDNQRKFFDVMDKLYGYLSSIVISVTNIENNLKNFISRIYLDFSVIEFVTMITEFRVESLSLNTKFFSHFKKKIIDAIRFLYNNQSVEIYTYVCDSYKTEIEKTRSLRILPLIDSEVNIKIIREADGIVSYLDCYNIEQFEKSNHIMMTYNILDLPNFLNLRTTKSIQEYLSDKTKKDIRVNLTPYSLWLRLYCSGDHDVGIFDILAGDIGFSFQMNTKYYDLTFNEFKIKYDKLYARSQYDVGEKEVIKIGYDEMLLNEMFKSIISINIDNLEIKSFDEINVYDILLILNSVFYPKIHLEIDAYEILKKTNINLSSYLENIDPSHELNFMEYILDHNIKKLVGDGQISVNDGVLSINKILKFLNQMPRKLGMENILFDLYKKNIHYGGEEKYGKKYLKYKQKNIQLSQHLVTNFMYKDS